MFFDQISYPTLSCNFLQKLRITSLPTVGCPEQLNSNPTDDWVIHSSQLRQRATDQRERTRHRSAASSNITNRNLSWVAHDFRHRCSRFIQILKQRRERYHRMTIII